MNISPFAFPLFGCFIIFILWFNYERRKHEKIEEKRDEDFGSVSMTLILHAVKTLTP